MLLIIMFIIMVITIDFQYTPILRISQESYEADSITVAVEWAQQKGVIYTVKVRPFVPTINSIENTSYQLTISYNKTYNFSVMAATPCRPNATAEITLSYGKIYDIQRTCV